MAKHFITTGFLTLAVGLNLAVVGCSLAVDTSDLTAGDAGLDCGNREKVCPVDLDDPDGPGMCIDIADPAHGCGDPDDCGACEVPGAVARCTSKGVCGISICEPLQEDCDANEENGCEVNIGNDEENCGACGVLCEREHGVASCVEGECRLVVCTKPYGDCDGNTKNGCETNIETSQEHCGACGQACAGSCVDGMCQ